MPGLIALIAAAAVAGAPQPVIAIDRYRSAGATVRKIVVYANGLVTIDDPSGGAGRRTSTKQLRPTQVRRLRRTIARTPWHHLSRRTASLPEVDPAAYFLLHHAGTVRTVMAAHLSVDLKPLVRRLNGIMDAGQSHLESAFFLPS
jgi:hypothetical protein